jgi:hypothetical protein
VQSLRFAEHFRIGKTQLITNLKVYIMAIKINAREQDLKVGKNPGYYYVMLPELYLPLAQQKVIR